MDALSQMRGVQMVIGGWLRDHKMDVGTGKGRSVVEAKIASRSARPLFLVAVDGGATRLEVGVDEVETEVDATEEVEGDGENELGEKFVQVWLTVFLVAATSGID